LGWSRPSGCEVGAVIGARHQHGSPDGSSAEMVPRALRIRMAKLHRINEKLAQTACRRHGVALPPPPFGLRNYLFGSPASQWMDVAIGTFSGGFVAYRHLGRHRAFGHRAVRRPRSGALLGHPPPALIPLACAILFLFKRKKSGLEDPGGVIGVLGSGIGYRVTGIKRQNVHHLELRA